MSFPYWRGANPFGGGGGAAQTLTYTAGTNTLGISGGNSVVINPTNISLPGTLGVTGNTTLSGTLGVTGLTSLADANIAGTLQTGGGFSAILNGGFTANQPSIVTRPVGNDAFLQVQNSAGAGIGIRSDDGSGIGSLERVAGGAGTDIAALTVVADNTVVITKNNIIRAPTTQAVQAGGIALIGPGAGQVNATIPTAGAPQPISNFFTVIPGNFYRYSINIISNLATTATTGLVNISITDSSGNVNQTIWTRSGGYLAVFSNTDSCSGIFQPSSTSVAFVMSAPGADQPVTLTFGGGSGGPARTAFVIEDLGVQ